MNIISIFVFCCCTYTSYILLNFIKTIIIYLWNENVKKRDPTNYKLMLCVRSDIKMTPGKIASQCAHAVHYGTLFDKSLRDNRVLGWCWGVSKYKTVVVKLNGKNHMNNVYEKCKKNGINCGFVTDAGRTQVDTGTRTVLWVGPEENDRLREVTGDLKIY